jgi:hypothetical protein
LKQEKVRGTLRRLLWEFQVNRWQCRWMADWLNQVVLVRFIDWLDLRVREGRSPCFWFDIEIADRERGSLG